MNNPFKRNVGLDALRILSMYFVLILHILLAGGILDSVPFLSSNYRAAWFLEIFAFCAVNCYALISGYVGYKANHNFSKLIMLYLQVAFYTIITTILYCYLNSSFSIVDSIRFAVLPFTSDQLWYVKAYFILFLLMPILDTVVEKTIQFRLGPILFIGLVVIFSILPCVFDIVVIPTKNGYSWIWISVLYIVGAICKHYNFQKYVKSYLLLALYFVCNLVAFNFKIASESLMNRPVTDIYADIRYIAPTILFASLALFFLFLKIKVPAKLHQIIESVAPTTFSVYIIHMCPLIYSTFISNRFIHLIELATPLFILSVLACAALIFCSCSIIDMIRIEIFNELEIRTTIINTVNKTTNSMKLLLRNISDKRNK